MGPKLAVTCAAVYQWPVMSEMGQGGSGGAERWRDALRKGCVDCAFLSFICLIKSNGRVDDSQFSLAAHHQSFTATRNAKA